MKSWELIYRNTGTTSNFINNTKKYEELLSIPREIDSNILINSLNIEKNSENTIEDFLKTYDNDFNIDNYIVTKSTCGSICVNDGKTRNTEFIDYTLKIGDFYTNAGYTAKVEDDTILAVYDNNVDKIKQKEILNQTEDFKMNFNTQELEEIKTNALRNSKYASDKVEIDENVSLFYDIEKDIKYVVIPIKSELEDNIGGKDILKDVILFEIN